MMPSSKYQFYLLDMGPQLLLLICHPPFHSSRAQKIHKGHNFFLCLFSHWLPSQVSRLRRQTIIPKHWKTEKHYSLFLGLEHHIAIIKLATASPVPILPLLFLFQLLAHQFCPDLNMCQSVQGHRLIFSFAFAILLFSILQTSWETSTNLDSAAWTDGSDVIVPHHKCLTSSRVPFGPFMN